MMLSREDTANSYSSLAMLDPQCSFGVLFKRTIDGLNRELLRFLLNLWAMYILPRLCRSIAKIRRTESDRRSVLVVQLLHPWYVLATNGDIPIRNATESTHLWARHIGKWMQSYIVDCCGDVIHEGEQDHQ